MTSLTNKNIEFLSDREFISILLSVLNEIDMVANLGAYRSTTYLAVSTIEGLFSEVLRLKQIVSEKQSNELALKVKYDKLQTAKVISEDFQSLFVPLIKYRNYVHPHLEDGEFPITQSVAQRALASLNSLIEQYEKLRFIANQEWHLEYGLAQVPANNVVYMPQNNDDPVSLLVSQLPAQHFQEITFRVRIPPHAIFNFIYNFVSLDKFMGARIEGRIGEDGGGLANGRIVCRKWRKVDISGRYTKETEPNPQKLDHLVKIVLNPPIDFSVSVDGVQIELENKLNWGLRPKEKIGFMTECGDVSILDLKVKPVQ